MSAEDVAAKIITGRKRVQWNDLPEDEQELYEDRLLDIDEKWNDLDMMDQLDASSSLLYESATEMLQKYLGTPSLFGNRLVQAYRAAKQNRAAQRNNPGREAQRENERKKLTLNEENLPGCDRILGITQAFVSIEPDRANIMNPNDFSVRLSKAFFDRLIGRAYVELEHPQTLRRVYARVLIPHDKHDDVVIATRAIIDSLKTSNAAFKVCDLGSEKVLPVTNIVFSVYGSRADVDDQMLERYLAGLPAISLGTELVFPGMPTLRVDELRHKNEKLFMGTLKIGTFSDTIHEWVVDFKDMQCRVCGNIAKYQCSALCGAEYCGKGCQKKDWAALHRHKH